MNYGNFLIACRRVKRPIYRNSQAQNLESLGFSDRSWNTVYVNTIICFQIVGNFFILLIAYGIFVVYSASAVNKETLDV